MTPPPPIRIKCEGSKCPAHLLVPSTIRNQQRGMCPMCGSHVQCGPDGRTYRHDRDDILAMIDRGDFE